MSFKTVILWTLMALVTGCAAGNCRQNRDKNKEITMTEQKNPAVLPTDLVKVFKYDGSLQCAMGKAISPTEMQKELKDIQVFSAESKMDGLMHMTVCGANTGQANVYTIHKKDLEAAITAGFKEWTYE